ncbi:MAG: Bifunctional homocysteine S-methyltransferase/5,10-methylenetetrahydrofolate reductase [Anaerolineales bacterium]|nr:Bifunctional homocysteine S-methyltransferase/5,10-methylenetetrahydrofolate reductase [Anaerolineales bacterium]
MNALESLLASNEYLLADGAMGTMLMAAGLEHGDPPEEWNVLHPDRVQAVHRGYIEAGSQIVLSNSFGGSRFRLELHGLQDRATELNRAAAEVARAAADAALRDVVVAGSMGPSGSLIEPLGTLTPEEARDGFAEQAAALAEGSVDVLWIETMSDLKEVQAAIEGVRSVTDLPVVTTMTFDTRGHTMMGVSPAKALAALREFGPLALGGNCGNGPEEIEGVIEAMHEADPNVVLVAKSNAGIPELVDGEVTYRAKPKTMAEHAVRARKLGARIFGACCGSTPAHIRAMAEALAGSAIE